MHCSLVVKIERDRIESMASTELHQSFLDALSLPCNNTTPSSGGGDNKKNLTMDKWAKWLESVLDDALEREKGSGRKMSEVAHNFLLNWSFYGYVLLL